MISTARESIEKRTEVNFIRKAIASSRYLPTGRQAIPPSNSLVKLLYTVIDIKNTLLLSFVVLYLFFKFLGGGIGI